MSSKGLSVGAPAGEDTLRSGLGEEQVRRQRWWLALLAGLLMLVSVFSGGLFLYAVVVVAVVYAMAVAMTAVVQRDLVVWRHLSAGEVELGGDVHARVVLQNRKPMPAFWLFWQDRLEDGLDPEGARGGFKTLEAEAKDRLSYRLHTTRRGLFRVGPLVLEATDPLGLVRRYRVDDHASFLTVLPRAVPLGQGWPLGHKPVHQIPRRRSLFEDPSRFYGIRQYRPGDSLRRVHWRATARSGEIQVKVFEPSVLDGALLAVDMDQDAYPRLNEESWGGVDPNEELAITAAASIGKYVLEGGQSVGLLANGADAAERYPQDWQGGSFRRLDEALDQAGARRRLVGHRPLELAMGKGHLQWQRLRLVLARACRAQSISLADLLTLELPRLSRSSVLMVITPRLDGGLASALGSLRRSGFELAVVWIGIETNAVMPSGLPEGLPVYRISRASDLEHLGAQRL